MTDKRLILYKKSVMFYPSDFETKIGFQIIRLMLKQECVSSLGEAYVDEMAFTDDLDKINCLVSQTWEFRNILIEGLPFPSDDFYDMMPELKRIKTDGTFIEKDSLLKLLASLKTIAGCIAFFNRQDTSKFPFLSELVKNVALDKEIIKRIESIIDEKGRIRDTASSSLNKIRTEMHSIQKVIDKKLSQTLQMARKEGWIKEDIEVTIRNGRAVLPVPVTYKRKIRGFIHDESASGQTVYIEPTEVFDHNNELRELELAERREIIKILTGLTDFIRPQSDVLKEAYQFLGRIDFIRAKARFAIGTESHKPYIRHEPGIRWIDALHPLLYLSHKVQGRSIVPLTVSLDRHQRILIISGPNAGGKSICLKTIGLLQYMIQTGMLVPMNEMSVMGLFSKLLIDIGDEQSIENDLSTYSSHLLNIKYFLMNTTEDSLFLIDEFGSGTEPQLGGAIAEAALERFSEKKTFGVVTTHYANLKLLEGRLDGVVNGAMLFDSRLMQPLYRLRIGHPGSSYAFEIANKIGFPQDILKNAEQKTGKTQLDFDQKLQQLEIEKEEVSKKETEFKVADEFLAEVIRKYENLSNELLAARQKILTEAREEARTIIEQSNRLIEKTIKEIRENKATKEETKKLREDIKTYASQLDKTEKMMVNKNELSKVKQNEPVKAVPVKAPSIAKGDYVKITGQDVPGEVIEIKGHEATIAFGHVIIKVHTDKLETISSDIETISTPRHYKTSKNIVDEINSRMANFKLSIDVRGKRTPAALAEIQKYIDDAILLGIPEISILHGKGDGILRTQIRELLKTVPQIRHFGDEHIERGGDGITVIRF
jgi:DNA mismatch repair protein MutS2